MESPEVTPWLEAEILKLKGIDKVHVEWANNGVRIWSVSGFYDWKSLYDILSKIAKVETITAQWPIAGMSCAACAVSSETVLKYLPGMLSASVNFTNAVALVQYLPSLTNPVLAQKALQEAGYDLLTEGLENTSEDPIAFKERLDRQHLKHLQRSVIGAWLLGLPLLMIGMFWMHMPNANFIMWILATPLVFYFGNTFFIQAWKQIRHGNANMDVLVALSTGVAYVFSVFNWVFSDYWHQQGMHAHVYFEAAGLVIAFVLLGRWLEANARFRTSAAIRQLMNLRPDEVCLVQDGKEVKVALSAVAKGNVLRIRPGDKIPVDGIVTEGASILDESMLNGEPIPQRKEIGDKVFAGTLNSSGSILLKAEKVGNDTVLANIIRAVQMAQGSKAPVQRLVDKIASVFVPIVLLISVITFLVWFFVGDSFAQALMSAVTVLVIACPCALGLATPTAIMVGVGKGAMMHLLIRDAGVLESAHRVNTVVLDKTGTLTKGKPAVQEILECVPLTAFDWQVWLAMESRSEHPVAKSIQQFLQTKISDEGLPSLQFESITGQGLKADIEGLSYFSGSRRRLELANFDFNSKVLTWEHEKGAQGMTITYFVKEGQLLALTAVADTIRAEAASFVADLKKMNLDVLMFTGDQEATAHYVADKLGISTVKANLLPGDKARLIKELQHQGKIVAMTGDGINDAEALAVANVSIAMGKGTDIAMEVAGITLMQEDLRNIPKALRLSALTMQTIKSNLFWAFIYNIIALPIAAGVLYPINGFLINPMIAGAAMAMSSVSVVLNSLRLYKRKVEI
jgi:Cu2+-exporting ATPase